MKVQGSVASALCLWTISHHLSQHTHTDMREKGYLLLIPTWENNFADVSTEYSSHQGERNMPILSWQPPELLKSSPRIPCTPDQNEILKIIVLVYISPSSAYKIITSLHLGKHVPSRHPAWTPSASYKLTSSIFADSESQDTQSLYPSLAHAFMHLPLHHVLYN